MDTDRNLLFGVLALQADLIDADRFAEACSAWAAKKATPLADLLQERGWISPEGRADVEKLLERKLRKHRGDAHASLADAADGRARGLLAAVLDPEVRGTLTGLAEHEGHTPVSTLDYEPGSRERYRLTHLHAQGGLGQVWLATDGDLGRQVALKELRPDRAGHPVLRSRFLEEAKITGQLEHPAIVPVYELARRSSDDQPFYTMRFVRGRTLAEAIRDYHRKRQAGDAGPLDLAALLTAFVGICQALAYAHARKVIHRDLKPQNVVLGDFGEVVVLDWGLAKLVDRPEDAAALASVALAEDVGREATVQGQVLGTPAYMAPEQAAGRLDQIDHRSDVYGLGAILYEVLTGRPPFEGGETREVLARVIHEAPTRPGRANPGVPRPLEAICLKALAKAPTDRYRSAGELAVEVQRYLADEPVAAYPEPWTVRTGRWIKRHRAPVAGAAVLMVTATIALTIGTLLLGRANAEAQRQRDEARENFELARRAVDDYFTTVSENTLLKSPQPGLQPLRKELLERALRYYQEFVRRRRGDPRMEAALAAASYRLGKITVEIGGGDALGALEEARERYEGLLRDGQREPTYRHELAVTYKEIGKQLVYAGRSADAIGPTRRANELEAQLVREHPDVSEYGQELGYTFNNLGVMHEQIGRPAEAREFYRRAVEVWTTLARAAPDGPHRLGLSKALGNLGLLQHRTGRLADSRATYEEAASLLRGLHRDDPANATCHFDLAHLLYNLGEHLFQSGEVDEASRLTREALDLFRDLTRRNPSVTQFRAGLVEDLILLGDEQVASGAIDDALRSYREGLEAAGAIRRDNPEYAQIEQQVMLCQLGIGRALSRRGAAAEALAPLREAVALGSKHAGDHYELLYHLAAARSLLGAAMARSSTPSEAGAALAEAVATLRRATAAGYRNLPWIKRDADLDPLRSRGDFKEWIAELESEQAAAK